MNKSALQNDESGQQLLNKSQSDTDIRPSSPGRSQSPSMGQSQLELDETIHSREDSPSPQSSSKKGFLQTAGLNIKMKTSVISNKFGFNSKRRDSKQKEKDKDKEKDQEKNEESKHGHGHGHEETEEEEKTDSILTNFRDKFDKALKDQEAEKNRQENAMIQQLSQSDESVDYDKIFAEVTEKDSLGRNAFHRCCIEQNPRILKMLVEKLEKSNDKNLSDDQRAQCKQKLSEALNLQDIFNNTPLLLACIYDNENKRQDQEETVDILLSKGANPNVQNLFSGFTPLHWQCRYGIDKTVLKLLKSNALVFIPDSRGFRPIDYSGKFNHHDVTKLLIEWTLGEIYRSDKKAIIKSIMNRTSGNFLEKGNFDIFQCNELLHSPVFHTSILYWYCKLPEKMTTICKIQGMLDPSNLSAYPEGTVKMDNYKTPCHAAAESGQYLTLQTLLTDIQSRWDKIKEQNKIREDYVTKVEDIRERNSKDRNNVIPIESVPKNEKLHKEYYLKLYSDGPECYEFYKSYEKILSFKALRKTKQIHGRFMERLNFYKDQMQKDKEDDDLKSFTFDFLDGQGRTPLHYACQMNKKDCAEILVFRYGCNIDICSENGLRPRDLIQHEEMKAMFQKFYSYVDTRLQSKKIERMNSVKKSAAMLPVVHDHGSHHHHTFEPVDEDQQRQLEFQSQEICLNNLERYYNEKNSKKQADQIKEILKSRQFLPMTSTFVIKVSAKSKDPTKSKDKKTRLDHFVKSLLLINFEVKMFPAVEADDTFYMLLEYLQEDLEKQAEQLKYPVKLANKMLKYQYMKIFKDQYEPFRSKDAQEIITQTLYKQINIKDLEKRGIIQSIFLMHNMNETYDILRTGQETSIYYMLRQMLFELPATQFVQLISIKNYYGEKIAFEQAFTQFYTCWLIYPAVIGTAVTIYQFVMKTQKDSISTLWAFFFAIVNSIWITLFIERWKRKLNELRLKFGTLKEVSTKQEIRLEFKGNEEFDHENHNVNRKDNKPTKNLWLVFNIIIQIIFISISLLIFFWTKSIRDEYKEYGGALNAVLVIIVNYIFTLVAEPLEEKQNNKHQQQYINSFALKVFIFKVVNTNISLIYTIYTQSTGEEDAQTELYNLIVGMIAVKMLNRFGMQFVYRWLVFHLRKVWYFRECQRLAGEQANKRKNKKSYLEPEIRAQHARTERTKEELFLYKHLKNQFKVGWFSKIFLKCRSWCRAKESEDEERGQIDLSYEYQRIVTVFRNKQSSKSGQTACFYKDPILVDQVELNDRLMSVPLVQEMSDQSEEFILMSFALLYSALCPIVSVLVMIYNAISRRLVLRANLFYVQRPAVVDQNGSGPWLIVMEFLAYATVISNCLFIYWFQDVFAKRIAEMFNLNLAHQTDAAYDRTESFLQIIEQLQGDQGQDGGQEPNSQLLTDMYNSIKVSAQDGYVVQLLIIVVVIEHLVLLVKTSIPLLIGDKPHWVQKNEIKVTFQADEIALEQANNSKKELIEFLQERKEKRDKSYKAIITRLEDMYGQLDKERTRYMRERDEAYQANILQEKKHTEEITNMKNEMHNKIQEAIREQLLGGSKGSKESSIYDKVKFEEELKEKLRMMQPELLRFIDHAFPECELEMANDNIQRNVEMRLQKSLQLRLYRETFLLIEAQILRRRVSKVSQSSPKMIINCVDCQQNMAEIQCIDCEGDFFCQDCFNSTHDNEVLKKHRTKILSVADVKKIQLQNNFLSPKAVSDDGWYKFEQFNFPLQQHNDLYRQLQTYFSYVKTSYIEMNHIDEDETLDIARFLLDQDYSMLGHSKRTYVIDKLKESKINRFSDKIADELADPIDESSMKLIQSLPPTVRGQTMFNDEEMLFMNRIAFYLMAKEGISLHFNDFIKHLKILQEGNYEDKIDLVLDILLMGKSESKAFIELDFLVCFVMSSMPQMTAQKFNAEEMLTLSFSQESPNLNKSMTSIGSDLDQSMRSDGLSLFDKKQVFMHRDQIKQVLVDNKDVRAIFECVLQQV